MATDVHGNILDCCPAEEECIHQTGWCNAESMREKCPFRKEVDDMKFKDIIGKLYPFGRSPKTHESAHKVFSDALEELGAIIIANTTEFYNQKKIKMHPRYHGKTTGKTDKPREIELQPGEVYKHQGRFWLLICRRHTEKRKDEWHMLDLSDFFVDTSGNESWHTSKRMRELIKEYFAPCGGYVEVINGDL